MALTFLLDEHLRRKLWRAIERHNQRGLDPLDVTRVGDPPDLPLGSQDTEIIQWASRESRILVSQDKKTVPGHLAKFLASGNASPGVFMIRSRIPASQVIGFLVMAAYTSDATEWENRVEFIP